MNKDSPAPEAHEITTLVHGGYLVAPNSGVASDPTELDGRGQVVGFHGYGENAERHLAELKRIPGSDEWRLCAVRALHRFYNTKTGDVIGSWMTSFGREQAIVDNIRYVAAVIARLERESGGIAPLVLAGFSQGVAMTYRAAIRCGYRCAGLIVLAGDVPPDVAKADQPLPPILLGRGMADEWYSAAKMDTDLELLAGLDVEVETCVFDGGHEWSPEFVSAAGAFLSRVKDTHRGAEKRMVSGTV